MMRNNETWLMRVGEGGGLDNCWDGELMTSWNQSRGGILYTLEPGNQQIQPKPGTRNQKTKNKKLRARVEEQGTAVSIPKN